jgi:hypothetical protein
MQAITQLQHLPRQAQRCTAPEPRLFQIAHKWKRLPRMRRAVNDRRRKSAQLSNFRLNRPGENPRWLTKTLERGLHVWASSCSIGDVQQIQKSLLANS